MTAPALVLVANPSADHRSIQAMHSARRQLQIMRSDLSINIAFLGTFPPTGTQVTSALAKRGVDEIVLIPLSLTAAVSHTDVAALEERLNLTQPSISTIAARPLGPDTEFLPMLDAQLRASLRKDGVSQLDALVLATPAAGDARGTALLQRRARQWSARHNLPVVLATNDMPGRGTGQAVAALRSSGRRHIAVGSLWLTHDEDYDAHQQAGYGAGALSVSAPIGMNEDVLRVAIARYAFASMALLDRDEAASPIAL